MNSIKDNKNEMDMNQNVSIWSTEVIIPKSIMKSEMKNKVHSQHTHHIKASDRLLLLSFVLIQGNMFSFVKIQNVLTLKEKIL